MMPFPVRVLPARAADCRAASENLKGVGGFLCSVLTNADVRLREMGLWPHTGVAGGAGGWLGLNQPGLQQDPSECLEEKRLLVLIKRFKPKTSRK